MLYQNKQLCWDAMTSAYYAEQLMKHEQAAKRQRLHHFQSIVKQRAELYDSLERYLRSEYHAKKLKVANIGVPNSNPYVLSRSTHEESVGNLNSSQQCSIRFHQNSTNSAKPGDGLSKHKKIPVNSSTLTAAVCKDEPHLLPVCNDEAFSLQARQLALYTLPRLFKVARQKTIASAEQDAVPLRQAVGRQLYGLNERRRARWLREQSESAIAAHRLKAEVESKLQSFSKLNIQKHTSDSPEARSLSPTSSYESEDKLVRKSSTSRSTIQPVSSSSQKLHNNDSAALSPALQGLYTRLISKMSGVIPKLCLCPHSGQVSSATLPTPWKDCLTNCVFHKRPENYLKALLDYITAVEEPMLQDMDTELL